MKNESLMRVLDAFDLKTPDKIPFHAYEHITGRKL
jgi:hypothetical protein